jgi:hypothetical protein
VKQEDEVNLRIRLIVSFAALLFLLTISGVSAQDEFFLGTEMDTVPREMTFINGDGDDVDVDIERDGSDRFARIVAEESVFIQFDSDGGETHISTSRMRIRDGALFLYTHTPEDGNCQGMRVVIETRGSNMVASLDEIRDCRDIVNIDEERIRDVGEDEWFDMTFVYSEGEFSILIGEDTAFTETNTRLDPALPFFVFEPADGEREAELDITSFSLISSSEAGDGADAGGNGGGRGDAVFDPEDSQEDIIASLSDLGLVPEDEGSYLFGEDYAYFFGQGSWYTPLSRRSVVQDVVVAGNLTFSFGEAEDFQTCGLMARVVTDGNGRTTQQLEVGFDATGLVYIIDLQGEGEGDVFVEEVGFRSGDTRHLLFVAMRGNVSVFVDGEPILLEQRTDTRAGSFGIGLQGRTSEAGCEGRDIWVWSFD